ncbi:MAG: FAD-dependent oxidoreductase, partial [Methanobacterium sp.]
ASMEAASFGENVTLIEGNKIGGTCLNEGCMVVCGLNDFSKFLLDAQNFKNMGIIDETHQYNFNNVINGVKDTISKISHVLELETKEAGANIVNGNAEIEEETVIVNGHEYEYDKLIISTGARPSIPEIEGIKNAMTYRDILKLKELPEKINIIGSGVIAAEFAGVFSTLGSEVNILCRNHFLGAVDEDIKNYVVKNLLPEVLIHENVDTKEIHEDHVSTAYGRIDGKTLLATGMTPNSEIAEKLVDLDEKSHIIVDKTMQTTHENIYAAGDVARKIGNTPISRAEGVTAARNACGIYYEMDYSIIPYAINLYYDVAFLNTENQEKGIEGYIPGSSGPGSFWRTLEGMTGVTKMEVNEDRGVNKIFSISSSSRASMAYISKLLREGQKIDDFDDFMEVHPSTDAIYKLMRFFARFE